MRTKKSILNFITAIFSQFIVILLGFISRRVLIYSVGVEYLGINGLMSNILSVFSLAESGIGVVIGYALYDPLSKNDYEKIKSLMDFYRKAYRLLAILTLILGLLFYPFLPFFLKGNTAPNTSIIYFLFLFSSVVSYLFSYKVTLNNSDQNNYLFTVANMLTQIIVLILKIIVLYITENYILFLLIDIFTTLVKNIIFSKIVDTKYPYIREKNIQKIDNDTKRSLFINIKSLFLGKLGLIISQCSDNLVISSIINITSLGLYSNYSTIISSISGFIRTFTSSITASMGNLIVQNDIKKNYNVFLKIDFINYWLYTFCSICMLCLVEPFVQIWLGKDYIMGFSILFFAVLVFYLDGLNLSVDMVKNATGLFYPDRYVPILQALANMFISIILAKRIGIAGVLIGTLISFIMFSFWIKPFLVYKYVFRLSLKLYFKMILKKIIVAFFTGGVCFCCVSNLNVSTNLMVNFILKMIESIFISNLVLVIIYHKNCQFKEISKLLLEYIKKIISIKKEL